MILLSKTYPSIKHHIDVLLNYLLAIKKTQQLDIFCSVGEKIEIIDITAILIPACNSTSRM